MTLLVWLISRGLDHSGILSKPQCLSFILKNKPIALRTILDGSDSLKMMGDKVLK